MDYTLPTEIEEFRREVRQFIGAELPPESERPRSGLPSEAADYKEFVQSFQRKLAGRKWLAMAWPEQFGGGGKSHLHQLVFAEEMSYADAPVMNMGIAWVGPSLMLFGTDEQKSKFIPGITDVRDWWCTLYSEPGAGSDLASLQTRAVRDGDDYVVTGQKIWTSGGHHANWGWLAARTDPDAPKHKGITMFVVDMASPGLTVRPLVNMANRHEFNEVFFDEVRVPASNVVGELNRGWYHLAVALDFERSSIGFSGSGRRDIEAMVKIMKDRTGLSSPSPTMRLEVADRNIELSVATLMAYQIAGMQSKGQVPNKEASISKNFGAEMVQRIGHTRIRLLGMLGQLTDSSKYQVTDAASQYLSDVPITIAGGTSEVNRSIIATRGLGLPRA